MSITSSVRSLVIIPMREVSGGNSHRIAPLLDREMFTPVAVTGHHGVEIFHLVPSGWTVNVAPDRHGNVTIYEIARNKKIKGGVNSLHITIFEDPAKSITQIVRG